MITVMHRLNCIVIVLKFTLVVELRAFLPSH